MGIRQNKGEWSELYAFVKLLKDGRIYAANERVEKLEDVYFPIIKLIKTDEDGHDIDYQTGDVIRIYKDGECLGEIDKDYLKQKTKALFERIFEGGGSGAFEIPESEDLIKKLKTDKIKASSDDKVDIRMQIHDIHTGIDALAGFSIKSDVGSPPTLLNAGKNTRFTYELIGINDDDMDEINSINKDTDNEYVKARMRELFKRVKQIRFAGIRNEKFEDNLMMLDSMMPEIYGCFILLHYMTMGEDAIDCRGLCELMDMANLLGFRKREIYTYKIKQLMVAAALGMTPSKDWTGYEAATGGYIIVKRDGDVLCYHIYNRNFFEDYLLNNTIVDRPSLSRHDFGYVYKAENRYLIDLNIQIRFKALTAATAASVREEEQMERIVAYIKKIYKRG